jgi:hypothetical protein
MPQSFQEQDYSAAVVSNVSSCRLRFTHHVLLEPLPSMININTSTWTMMDRDRERERGGRAWACLSCCIVYELMVSGIGRIDEVLQGVARCLHEELVLPGHYSEIFLLPSPSTPFSHAQRCTTLLP